MLTIIYVVGPTAVGKTALAFNLAKKFNGELVNADSVQVYKNLDVISGKDNPKNSAIPIHLLDVISPTETFSVSQFQKLGEKTIETTFSKNKQPIVVGGTGLYVKSLIDGIPTKDVPNNQRLRLELESWSVKQLQEKLSSSRLSKMNKSDRNNKRRLIRAIEIEKAGFTTFTMTVPFPGANHIQVGLFTEREILKERISERVEERLRRGALKEAKGLFENYKNLSEQVKNTNGYKQLFSFLKKEITFDEAVEQWKISEHQLSKRQMTWFVADKRIQWVNILDKDFEAKIESLIRAKIL